MTHRPTPPADGPVAEPMPWRRHLRRALARRFPRLRRVWVWLRHHAPDPRPRRLIASLRWLLRLLAAQRARRREPRLTVAVDVAAFWEPLTGVGWYLYRLLEQLADRDDLRLRLYGPTLIASPDLPPPRVEIPAGPAIERVLYEVPEGLVLPQGTAIQHLRSLEPLLVAGDRNEVLFAPNYFLPDHFGRVGGALVVTIHDLGVRKVPWTLQRETLQNLTEKLEQTLFHADRIITDSGAVRDELVAFGLARRERIRVVHLGPAHAGDGGGEIPEGVPERFALHVGTLEPRKNLSNLLTSWRLLQRLTDGGAPILVLCGRYGWKSGGIRRQVEAAAREGWIVHLGYVEERQLSALYRRAAVVVFPSIYEGFGLPAVEALRAGTPLVCSDLPVLREVAGEAALFADAGRPEALAAALRRVLSEEDLRLDLRRRGRAQARRFDWSRTAEATVEVWRGAAGRPS